MNGRFSLVLFSLLRYRKMMVIYFIFLFLCLSSLTVSFRKASPKVQSSTFKNRLFSSNNNDNVLVFAGVKFADPIASSLKSLDIIEPSPIQRASIAALTAGQSAILHAETGSGKTLAYVLPLLKRLLSSPTRPLAPLQALILVPTKELAIQVAADVTYIMSGSVTASTFTEQEAGPVHLCLTTNRRGLDQVQAPIVIGTPTKVMDAMRQSSASSFRSMNYVVLDEVDRLIPAVGRYATTDDIRRVREEQSASELVLSNLLRARGSGDERARVQVVAVSATVGRPLRRELSRIMTGGDSYDAVLPVIRASAIDSEGDANTRESDGADGEEDSNPGLRISRFVGIPKSIKHVCVLVDCEARDLSPKIVGIKEKWLTQAGTTQRGLLFVPEAEDVKQTVGMLRFWGLQESVDLQDALGLTQVKPTAQTQAQKQSKKLSQSQIDSGSQGAAQESRLVSAEGQLERAHANRLGAASRLPGDSINNSDNSNSKSATARELFVTSVSGTRGLHLQDVDTVFITNAPKTMDEYLHMAGRTGRYGNKQRDGTVISFVNYDEMKRLQSWQVPLGIQLKILFS